MRIPPPLCFALVLIAGSVLPLPVPDPISPVLGISPAQARGYYTRKRVRGRWVTGRFARGVSAPRRPGRPTARSEASRAVHVNPAPAGGQTSPRAVAAPEVGSPAGQTSTPVPLTRDERLRALQEALQARARSMVSNLGAVPDSRAASALPNPAQPTPEASQPRSVLFDVMSGVKTTVFGDGAEVREPFDPALIRELASVRPTLPPP